MYDAEAIDSAALTVARLVHATARMGIAMAESHEQSLRLAHLAEYAELVIARNPDWMCRILAVVRRNDYCEPSWSGGGSRRTPLSNPSHQASDDNGGAAQTQ